MSDMHISGSGSIPAGEYGSVSISGSGKCTGTIRCQSFSAAGSGRAEENVYCTGSFRASGSFHGNGSVEAESIHVAGSCHIEGDCTVKGELRASGSCRIGRKLSAQGQLHIAGSCQIEGDAEAESAYISGRVQVDGLLNAETVEIKTGGYNCRIGSIGCSRLEVRREDHEGRFFVFKWQVGSSRHGLILDVADSIEGDELYLEYTRAKRVSGRKIVLGEGCEIETIQYSESLEGTTVNDCKIEKVS